MPPVERTIVINATAPVVWEALTIPGLMTQWMGEPETAVRVATDWTVGGPIVISGFHHAKFENRGTVLRFEPHSVLRYSHLSSLSRLPAVPENHSVFEFRLAPVGDSTTLTLTLSGFPNEVIFKHLEFYWRGTLVIFKHFVERVAADASQRPPAVTPGERP